MNRNAQAIALDIGTSGIRAQLLDIGSKKVLRTNILSKNPLPGSNVMDHLTFAINYGNDLARNILLKAVNDLIAGLRPDDLQRISVCGNPIQLSIFEGIEIRDLAYAGENKLRSENVRPVKRDGHIIQGDSIGLAHNVDIIIPPAVKHEIGADALAMMLKSGFLDDDLCMVTDYGTNAEMALKVGDRVYTGSAASGPALEGQHITSGMLAGPGAISDMRKTPEGWVLDILDHELVAREGPILNIRNNMFRRHGAVPKGITGTGVIALMYAGMQDDCIDLPTIRGGQIGLGRNISFSENDLKEAGKAVGAIRAGQMTLISEAGIDFKDVRTMYMAGATGTYVDPLKAKHLGIVPSCAERIVQVGNTSLELAKDIALDPEMLDELNVIKKELLASHIMFASSPTFSELYLMELAYWTEGMPLDMYRTRLSTMTLNGYLDAQCQTVVERHCVSDIRDIGGSLEISEPNVTLEASWKCRQCMKCVQVCPENALSFTQKFRINAARCLGSACCRCEESCEDGIFKQSSFKLSGT